MRNKNDRYLPVDFESIPAGTTWKPAKGRPSSVAVILYSFGGTYKLIRTLASGKAQYFKLEDTSVKSPAEKIDAEPELKRGTRYRVGAHCWFIGDAHRWFLCKVVTRDPKTITISPVTGWDADRFVQWPHPDPLQFSSRNYSDGDLFRRLRPLRDRYQ